MIREPVYQVVLASEEGAEQLFIMILDETEVVDGVKTRVLEEREFVNGKLKEISRNFYVICREHNDVFYFGEDVDTFTKGKVTGHGGAWRSGVDGARAGLMIAGTIKVGAKYYQEVAPGVAMDRGEDVSNTVTFETPAGTFENCLKVDESSALKGGMSLKVYAPGVGMIVDDELKLVSYGYGRTSPEGVIDVAALPRPKAIPGGRTEIKSAEEEMPAPVAAVVAKLHPTGTIKEVKREVHPDGKIVYAIEIMVDGLQHDVEATPDGTVLRNEAE